MKIVFLNFYGGENNRGVESFIKELSTRLKVKVFDGKAEGNIFSFTLKVLFNLKNNFDVIVPTNGRSQVFLCRLWSWVLGKKMLVTGHSGIGFDDYLNLWARPDVFVTMSDFQKSWAKRFGFGVKIEKIPNGVDLEKFTPQGKEFSHGLPGKVVLSVSALTSPKRVDLIIRAVAKTNRSLLIVGDGPLKADLESLGNNLLPGRFKILKAEYNQMPEIYRSADTFVFVAYERESFGIVLLEAMASGLPIVTSDDPIRREIVGEAGLFVDPTNLTDFAQKLTTEQNGDTIKQAEKFSWDKISREYEKVFSDLTADCR